MTAPSIDRATEIERLAALESMDYDVARYGKGLLPTPIRGGLESVSHCRPPSDPSQRHNSDERGTSSAFQNVTPNVTQAVVTTEAGVTFQESDVTFQKCEIAAPNGHCDAVTFQKVPADACAHCQQPETPAHPLLQVGIDGYCVQLHRGCMDGYASEPNGGNSR